MAITTVVDPRRIRARAVSPVLALALLLGGAAAPWSASAQEAGGPAVAPPNAQPQAVEPSAEEQAAHEEHLLREVSRYLNLTRSQIRLLYPQAKYIGPTRAFLRQAQEEERRVIAEAPQQSDEAERLRQAAHQRTELLTRQILQLTAPQLARILTREQIALIWRLGEGRPPKYTEPDPELIEPEAGFRQNRSGELDLFLSNGAPSGATRLRSEADLRSVRFRILTLTEGLAEEGAVAGLQVPQALAQTDLGRRLTFQGSVTGREDKPFPQLVVETNDINDLLPVLEPFAQRVFLSDQWPDVLQELSVRPLGISPARRRRAPQPHRLVRDYRMEQGLRDLTHSGPELESLGGVLDHGRYVFDAGQGLRLEESGVSDDYDLEMTFRFEGGDSYQKFVDFKNCTQDGGLYAYQGHLTFYTLANGGAPEKGVDHRLRLVRDASTRIVRCYLDLRPVFAFIDLDDDAVFDRTAATFFVDDVTTKNEQGPGALRWLSIRGPAPAR